MSRLFRSEEMSLYQMYMDYGAAYYLVAEIGEAGIVEFKDVRKYVIITLAFTCNIVIVFTRKLSNETLCSVKIKLMYTHASIHFK